MKRAISFILVLSLCFSLAACATKKAVIGTWEGNWSYDGADIHIILSISEDNTYSKASYRNGLFRGGETGTWELDGNELELYHDSVTTPYDFNGSTLVNNGHKLKKQ